MLMDATYPSRDSSPTQMTASPTDEGRKTCGDATDSPVAGTIVEFPGLFDVMMGRGIGPNEHPGNKRYRTIVHSFQSDYLATKKRNEKEKIARKAIRNVKANGARFIKQVEGALVSTSDGNKEGPKGKKRNSKQWVVVEKETVLEKTKQALRFVGHYQSSKSKQSGDISEGADEGDYSSGGGASLSKASTRLMKSKGQEYTMGSIVDRGVGRQSGAVMPPMRGGARQEPSPIGAATTSSRFPPAPHHLHPSASTLLSQHVASSSLSSQVSSSSALLRQQQEIIANQEQLMRAVATGLGPSATSSLLGGLGGSVASYGGLGDPLGDHDLSRIALLLQHSRRSQQQQEVGDTTNLLFQRLAAARSSTAWHPQRQAQPNVSALDRLLLGLPAIPSSLGGGSMGDVWTTPQGGQRAPPSSSLLGATSRNADAASTLRALILPTSREFLPMASSISGVAGGGTTHDGLLLPTSGRDSRRSDSSPLSSKGRQNADLAAQNSALLSLLRQRQQQTTNEMPGTNHRPPADLIQALTSHLSAELRRSFDQRSPPDPPRNNDEEGKRRE
jgi:hypothetical protein